MALGLKGAELRAAIAKLRSFLMAGDSDDEAAAKMGLGWEDFEDLKAAFYEEESADLRGRSQERWFTDYTITQAGNIRALDEVIEEFKDGKQPNARVGAIKAKADITDRIMDRGMEMGFIKKTPDRKDVTVLSLVANLSNEELRRSITGEMEATGALVSKYGSGSIVDITPGPLHRAPPKVKAIAPPKPTVDTTGRVLSAAEILRMEDEGEEPTPLGPAATPGVSSPTKAKPHARARVHKGRRVVKGEPTTLDV